MSNLPDLEHLDQSWRYWSGLQQLSGISVSTECADCVMLFSSNEASVHLRRDGDWWTYDSVDDRGQLHVDEARFTSFALMEKYLIWMWASAARAMLRAPLAGPKLYASGFDPEVEAIPIRTGIYELRSPEGRAVLMEPWATIFSHLMGTPLDEIERIVRSGINA